MNPDHHDLGSVVGSKRKALAEAATRCGSCVRCNPGFFGMYLCATCGNKRCPSTASCDYECTGSNDTGQTAVLRNPPPSPAAAIPLPESDLAGRLAALADEWKMYMVAYPATTQGGAAAAAAVRLCRMEMLDLLASPADTGHTPTEALTVRNPHLPEKPADGRHIFAGSYRCKRCGVYNRPDVPSTKEVLDADCQGEWAQSGKMRAYAADQWGANLASPAPASATETEGGAL